MTTAIYSQAAGRSAGLINTWERIDDYRRVYGPKPRDQIHRFSEVALNIEHCTRPTAAVMAGLASLAYVSSASRLLSEAELETLLLSARERNREDQLTGVLLYHDGSFFQYLEGPQAELEATYVRIVASKQHHGIIRLFHHGIQARHFDQWQMGFSHAPRSLLLRLSQASWVQTLAENVGTDTDSSGVRLLLGFWKNAKRVA